MARARRPGASVFVLAILVWLSAAGDARSAHSVVCYGVGSLPGPPACADLEVDGAMTWVGYPPPNQDVGMYVAIRGAGPIACGACAANACGPGSVQPAASAERWRVDTGGFSVPEGDAFQLSVSVPGVICHCGDSDVGGHCYSVLQGCGARSIVLQGTRSSFFLSCNFDWSCDAVETPPAVAGVRFADRARLEWDGGAAATYDVVQGRLDLLRAGGGDFAPSVTACLLDDAPVSFSPVDVNPTVGAGYYYVVRGNGCSGQPGTYDDPGDVASRDPGINSSVNACAAVCDDFNPCTDDSLDAILGCVHQADDSNSCSTWNYCTTGACSSGTCVVTPVPDGTPCTDGNACTGHDSCSAGVCQGGVSDCYSDGNPCTVDSCNPDTGCVFTPVDCDDGDPCTSDSCQIATGQCVHTPVPPPCP